MKSMRRLPFMLRAAGAAAAAALLLTSCGGAADEGEISVLPQEELVAGAPISAEDSVIREEAGALSMDCDLSAGTLTVTDTRSGAIWSSAVNMERFGITTNKTWTAYMQSLFAFSYVDVEADNGVVQKAYSANEPADVKAEKIPDGVRLRYRFSKTKIQITAEIRLDQEGLRFTLPAKGIAEEGKYGLVSVEVLPFFGAADHTVDGYILFPDGSGSLMDYADYQNRPANVKTYRLPVYFPDAVTQSTLAGSSAAAMLPVFGIRQGENGFIAFAAKGEADGEILVSPEGANVALNRCAFAFRYRNNYEVKTAADYQRSAEAAEKEVVHRYDEKPCLRDREVSYRFLTGGASYDAMAVAYREYLQSRDLLPEKAAAPAMHLDIFMGVKDQGFLWDEFLALTTYRQAADILEELAADGAEALRLRLIGWSAGGYGADPGQGKPESGLGGRKELQSLAETAAALGIPAALQTDLTSADAKSSGFSVRRDAVQTGGLTVLTDEAESWYLLNPAAVRRRQAAVMKQMVETTMGLALAGGGSRLYPDYCEANPTDRTDALLNWQTVLRKMKEEGRPAAIQGGNQYVLPYADWLYDIPEEDSRSPLSSRAVPFYQIVVSGSIPYSGAAGNQAYDRQQQKLKWVEYGCAPTFEVTHGDPVLLRDTAYNQLFSSRYADWAGTIREVYREFTTDLAPVFGQPISSHRQVEAEVYETGYANGCRVLVNYGEQERKIDGRVVPAADYLLITP